MTHDIKKAVLVRNTGQNCSFIIFGHRPNAWLSPSHSLFSYDFLLCDRQDCIGVHVVVFFGGGVYLIFSPLLSFFLHVN